MFTHQRTKLIMRTTLDIESTALEAARQIAAHRAQSLGRVVSELILKALQTESAVSVKAGFPVFSAAPGARPITLDDVKRAEDDE